MQIKIRTDAKTFPVFSMRMAGHLMTLGFVLLDIGEDRRRAGKKVCYFASSPQIEAAMQDYLNKRY